MILAVLGCWAPYPAPGGACPGYLVQVGEEQVLFDCGNGTLGRYRYFASFRDLTAVVITHFHPDHFADLFALRHALAGALRAGKRGAPVVLVAPAEPADEAARWERYPEVFAPRWLDPALCASPQEVLLETAQGLPLRLFFLATPHSLPNLAVRLEAGGRSVVYTGDTAWHEPLVAFASGADLLVCEATLQEKDRTSGVPGHLTAREAGCLAQRAGVRRLLLTHFWPEHDLEVTRAEARAAFSGEVLLAFEGLVISV